MNDRIDNVIYSLYCNLPSQLLVQSIVSYFNSPLSGKFGELFDGNVFSYRRDDTEEKYYPQLMFIHWGLKPRVI